MRYWIPKFQHTLILLLLLLVLAPSRLRADGETKGVRVYFSGHSFHVFMPGILADLAKKGEIKDHTQLGLSSIGGSRVHQHWAVAQSNVGKDFKEAALPIATIPVTSTARFPTSGEIVVQTSEGEVTVRYDGLKGNQFTGCQGGKGILKAGAKISSTSNAAREALKSGKVDVFTMSPIYLPDDGVENFVKLAVEKNPKIRVIVQENWLPWDQYDTKFKAPAKVDHNAPTADGLRKTHAPYFKSIEDHVAELNQKYKTTAVRVAPIGQAVIKLREAILEGKAPGLKEQNDLFTDPIGHAKPPLAALASYCYYALIYEKSPVGLPAPAVLARSNEGEKLNRLLQEIAWETVTSHPMSGVKK